MTTFSFSLSPLLLEIWVAAAAVPISYLGHELACQKWNEEEEEGEQVGLSGSQFAERDSQIF